MHGSTLLYLVDLTLLDFVMALLDSTPLYDSTQLNFTIGGEFDSTQPYLTLLDSTMALLDSN